MHIVSASLPPNVHPLPPHLDDARDTSHRLYCALATLPGPVFLYGSARLCSRHRTDFDVATTVAPVFHEMWTEHDWHRTLTPCLCHRAFTFKQSIDGLNLSLKVLPRPEYDRMFKAYQRAERITTLEQRDAIKDALVRDRLDKYQLYTKLGIPLDQMPCPRPTVRRRLSLLGARTDDGTWSTIAAASNPDVLAAQAARFGDRDD